ncbi:MAG: hypothetical protein AB4352_10130 [Hormoscilla sp.]
MVGGVLGHGGRCPPYVMANIIAIFTFGDRYPILSDRLASLP